RNVYMKSIADANKLNKEHVASAVKETLQASGNLYDAKNAVSSMHKDLPFTAQPLYEPQARQVLAQALKKGQSVPQAIGTVKKFFQRQVEAASRALGMGVQRRSQV